MADLFREAPLDRWLSDRPRVTGLVTNWLSWLDGLFQQGAAAPSAWIPERMEYPGVSQARRQQAKWC